MKSQQSLSEAGHSQQRLSEAQQSCGRRPQQGAHAWQTSTLSRCRTQMGTNSLFICSCSSTCRTDVSDRLATPLPVSPVPRLLPSKGTAERAGATHLCGILPREGVAKGPHRVTPPALSLQQAVQVVRGTHCLDSLCTSRTTIPVLPGLAHAALPDWAPQQQGPQRGHFQLLLLGWACCLEAPQPQGHCRPHSLHSQPAGRHFNCSRRASHGTAVGLVPSLMSLMSEPASA